MAEWFWTDRWMGSSGFLLPMLARGLYREMLTQAWRRGAKLPNDPQSIQRAIGCTSDEWLEAWPLVSRFWRVDASNNLVNDTQLEVYTEAKAQVQKNHDRAVTASRAAQEARQGHLKVNLKNTPPSPSPSPSPISETVSVSDSEKKTKIAAVNGNGHDLTARSKRPIYQSDRFVVFEWQLDDLSRMLGPHTNDFDLHHFFDALSQSSRQSGLIIPTNARNGQFWNWLQAQVKSEAERRGLQFAEVPFESKQTQQLKQSSREFLSRGAGPKNLRSNV